MLIKLIKFETSLFLLSFFFGRLETGANLYDCGKWLDEHQRVNVRIDGSRTKLKYGKNVIS